MSVVFKKMLVLLPVVILGIFYMLDHSELYSKVSGKRILFLVLTLSLLYSWFFLEVALRKQKGAWDLAVQSGYFIYIFMVLTLTGYFILFREVSANIWWERLQWRIDHRDHVNTRLFQIFRIYEMSNTQILGNFVMLLPLGIFIPLLYRRLSGFFPVLISCFLVSMIIEFLQLITSYRSADVDDVMLNTLGAVTGYLCFRVFKAVTGKKRPAA